MSPIRFGTPGNFDINGILAPLGRRIEIEVKTGKAVLSKEQKAYGIMIDKFGGLQMVARSVEQAIDAIKLQHEIDLDIQNKHKLS